MKKIAFIFLLIFTLVQVVPAVNAINGKAVSSLFAPDEEKEKDHKSNTLDEKKHKPDYFVLQLQSLSESFTAALAFHHSERHYTSPVMEKLVPPPNHC